MKKLPKSKSGQALLIILLVMSIGLTVSLGLLSRTTTDIKLSRQFEESSRALSAAEAGVEEALRQSALASGNEVIAPGISYDFTSQDAGQGTGPFSLGKILKENVGTVWLTEHSNPQTLIESAFYTASTILLCWKPADANIPDIETIILYKDGSDYKVARGFYQSGSASGGTESCDSSYPYQTDVSLPSGVLLALRLKPIGGDAFVAVNPQPDPQELPSQGKEVISTGKAGDTVRKVRVIKSYPSWPEIFDYALFSGGELIKY